MELIIIQGIKPSSSIYRKYSPFSRFHKLIIIIIQVIKQVFNHSYYFTWWNVVIAHSTIRGSSSTILLVPSLMDTTQLPIKLTSMNCNIPLIH